VDIRVVRLAFVIALSALVACGGPEPTEPAPGKSGRDVPAAVRYDQYGAAANIAPPAAALVNPFSADPGAVEQGAALFDAMNCSGCHGGGAVGFVGPSLVDGRWRYGGEDGALFHSIFYGRPHGMPAYGGMLSDTTVWQLVSYVQSQPVPDVVPTVAWP
jgi:cytochrome c oxidase cbb3-type subunit 3